MPIEMEFDADVDIEFGGEDHTGEEKQVWPFFRIQNILYFIIPNQYHDQYFKWNSVFI